MTIRDYRISSTGLPVDAPTSPARSGGLPRESGIVMSGRLESTMRPLFLGQGGPQPRDGSQASHSQRRDGQRIPPWLQAGGRDRRNSAKSAGTSSDGRIDTARSVARQWMGWGARLLRRSLRTTARLPGRLVVSSRMTGRTSTHRISSPGQNFCAATRRLRRAR